MNEARPMTQEITIDTISPFRESLEHHPIYDAIESLDDLRCFMEHHVYSVWDFMSLIKYLQAVVAPTQYPWTPQGDASVKRFINELVLEEETDETQTPGAFSSHFELYQQAMKEIGANVEPSAHFVQIAASEGIDNALSLASIPSPAKRFTSHTFHLITANKPHEVAAALALGREHIIPSMFRSIISRIGVSEAQAPIFHFYLNRHIHLDEDFHAPLSLRLLNGLCAGSSIKVQEAMDAGELAVKARLEFWDGVLAAIKSNPNDK